MNIDVPLEKQRYNKPNGEQNNSIILFQAMAKRKEGI
jgi:hypothetical protein